VKKVNAFGFFVQVQSTVDKGW